MAQPSRPVAFILASTDHGTMIVNRFDMKNLGGQHTIGVGAQLLSASCYDAEEANQVMTLLEQRRRHFGDGVRVLDIGANIGVFTIEWAKFMTGWGDVLAFEAQERVFLALGGNVVINNCFNARPIHAAVTRAPGVMRISRPEYRMEGSFGSLELRQSPTNEFIGQPIDYRDENMMNVAALSVDSLEMSRVDLIKVDVEGMEIDVLEGARKTIGDHRPILFVERVKTDESSLRAYFSEFGYEQFARGMNIVAVHPSDPTIEIARGGFQIPAGGTGFQSDSVLDIS